MRVQSEGHSSQYLIHLLFILLMCLILIVFSVYKIIAMAQPIPISPASQLKQEPYSARVIDLIQASEPLDYGKFKEQVASFFPNSETMQAKFNFSPQIEQLPQSDQNYIIRLNLMEWRLDQIQAQIYQMSSASPKSLIFNIGFWIYSLLIWISTTIGGRIMTFYTDIQIQKYWKNI